MGSTPIFPTNYTDINGEVAQLVRAVEVERAGSIPVICSEKSVGICSSIGRALHF